MKRFSKTLAAALIIVATAAAFMVGCKKEQMPQAIEAREDETTLARIMDFKRQLEAVEVTSTGRTVTYMSIADAVWNIEALFNYSYAHPNQVYGQTSCSDTTLNLQVCANDSVSLVELSTFYGQMYETIHAVYHASVLNNKRLVIVDVEAGEHSGNKQTIELHIVLGSDKGEQPQPGLPQLWEPFEEGHLWYYGLDHENIYGLPVDAADTLTIMLNAILVQKAPEGSEYVYSNIQTRQTLLGEHYANPYQGYPNVSPRYCEFYKENPTLDDYWLDSDQMNYYYFGERHLVLNVFPNDASNPVPGGLSLFKIIVEDNSTNTTIEHHTKAYYGYRECVSQGSIINSGDL